MIEFNCPNRKYDGTPVICDLEVMAFAEAQVGDYKPALLRESAKINAIHFVELYLEASVDAQNIGSPVPAAAAGEIFSKEVPGDGERRMCGWEGPGDVQILRSEQDWPVQLNFDPITKSREE